MQGSICMRIDAARPCTNASQLDPWLCRCSLVLTGRRFNWREAHKPTAKQQLCNPWCPLPIHLKCWCWCDNRQVKDLHFSLPSAVRGTCWLAVHCWTVPRTQEQILRWDESIHRKGEKTSLCCCNGSTSRVRSLQLANGANITTVDARHVDVSSKRRKSIIRSATWSKQWSIPSEWLSLGYGKAIELEDDIRLEGWRILIH